MRGIEGQSRKVRIEVQNTSNPIKPNPQIRVAYYGSQIAHYVGRFSFLISCFALIFLICVVPVLGQDSSGHITGQVIDRKGNRPLVDQKVILTIHQGEEAQQRETITGNDGSYIFDNLRIAFDTYYTVSTSHEGKEYSETDLVLSTWVPELKVDIEIGAFTDDPSKVKVRQHTLVITPPPADHAPDGAVSVMEIIQVENTSDLAFQTTLNGQPAGLHLNLPNGHEGLQLDSVFKGNLIVDANQLVSSQPLAPGAVGSGFSYIMHVKNSGLDLSRLLTFDTDQLYVFIAEGMPLTPQSSILGAGRREQIHEMSYTIYPTDPAKPLSIGQTAKLSFKVAPVAPVGGAQQSVVDDQREPGNPTMIALIAVAAACAGGFLVAAIFMVRSSTAQPTESQATQTTPDTSWLNKLDSMDLERARVARLEMVTRLDEMYEKKEISERVYNRLRKEQIDRLAPILEKTRGVNHQ